MSFVEVEVSGFSFRLSMINNCFLLVGQYKEYAAAAHSNSLAAVRDINFVSKVE